MTYKVNKSLILESVKDMVLNASKTGKPMSAEEIHNAVNMQHGTDADSISNDAHKAEFNKNIMGMDSNVNQQAKAAKLTMQSKGL